MRPVNESLLSMGDPVVRVVKRIIPLIGSLFLGFYHSYRAMVALQESHSQLRWFGKITKVGLFLLSGVWNLVAFIGMTVSVSVMVFHPLAFAVLAVALMVREAI